jgi:hypothetical protein
VNPIGAAFIGDGLSSREVRSSEHRKLLDFRLQGAVYILRSVQWVVAGEACGGVTHCLGAGWTRGCLDPRCHPWLVPPDGLCGTDALPLWHNTRLRGSIFFGNVDQLAIHVKVCSAERRLLTGPVSHIAPCTCARRNAMQCNTTQQEVLANMEGMAFLILDCQMLVGLDCHARERLARICKVRGLPHTHAHADPTTPITPCIHLQAGPLACAAPITPSLRVRASFEDATLMDHAPPLPPSPFLRA